MRDAWSFNSTVQFLANRGYAVLQVNARGSSGYGEPFRNLAKKEIGGKVQLDLADGARWAIRHDYADPARVGVMGFGSFGGYSALMNLALEPGLYCCGIASEPYTHAGWIDESETEPAKLRAASPLNLADQFKAPVLLAHNRDGTSFNNTKAMAAALKKAGCEVQFNSNYNDRHYGYERHAKWLTEIEEFLAKHMPASVPPANSVPAAK
jgi:dipeptidyl aminopeptidase/acylaminoacyl peptidase